MPESTIDGARALNADLDFEINWDAQLTIDGDVDSDIQRRADSSISKQERIQREPKGKRLQGLQIN